MRSSGGSRGAGTRHRVDYAFTRAGCGFLVVDKISTVPRGYCRNRLVRPNSQACTRIVVPPEVAMLVPVSMRSRTVLKAELNTIVPRSPIPVFCFLYSKILTVTKMRLSVCFNETALFGPFVALIKGCSSYDRNGGQPTRGDG